MPKLSQRNRKRRRVQVRLPGGRTAERQLPRKPSKPRCSETGRELHGIPRNTRRVPGSTRTVQRPYGGHLSSQAMREKILSETTALENADTLKPEDIIKVGRMCIKLAGRDAGMRCVIVDVLDDNHVLVDGQTRRRKCNVDHLQPLPTIVKLKKGASHSDVSSEFKKLNIDVRETKPKKTPPRPKKQSTKKSIKPKPAEKPAGEEAKRSVDSSSNNKDSGNSKPKQTKSNSSGSAKKKKPSKK